MLVFLLSTQVLSDAVGLQVLTVCRAEKNTELACQLV